MFIQFNREWLETLWQYCHRHPFDTLEVTYFLTRYRLGTTPVSKRDGNLYISIEGDAVNGLAFFNQKGVLFISYETEDMFKKVDFLKTIHREQPRQVRGQKQQVERLFYFLQRILKDFSFHESLVMVKEGALSSQLQPDNHHQSAQYPLPSLVDAHTVDWLVNAKFLLAVEQHFRAHTITINNLRHKIHQRQAFEFYRVLLDGDKAIAQVIGEFATDQMLVIGGVYVLPAYRKRGLGTLLCQEAIEQSKAMHKQPALYVAKQNIEAISLYKQLGFEEKAHMLDMGIKL